MTDNQRNDKQQRFEPGLAVRTPAGKGIIDAVYYVVIIDNKPQIFNADELEPLPPEPRQDEPLTVGERIIAAAVKTKHDLFTGLRHGQCFEKARAAGAIIERIRFDDQGFLTNSYRFVSRSEAAKIALKAGQISEPKGVLMSEDIWADELQRIEPPAPEHAATCEFPSGKGNCSCGQLTQDALALCDQPPAPTASEPLKANKELTRERVEQALLARSIGHLRLEGESDPIMFVDDALFTITTLLKEGGDAKCTVDVVRQDHAISIDQPLGSEAGLYIPQPLQPEPSGQPQGEGLVTCEASYDWNAHPFNGPNPHWQDDGCINPQPVQPPVEQSALGWCNYRVHGGLHEQRYDCQSWWQQSNQQPIEQRREDNSPYDDLVKISSGDFSPMGQPQPAPEPSPEALRLKALVEAEVRHYEPPDQPHAGEAADGAAAAIDLDDKAFLVIDGPDLFQRGFIRAVLLPDAKLAVEQALAESEAQFKWIRSEISNALERDKLHFSAVDAVVDLINLYKLGQVRTDEQRARAEKAEAELKRQLGPTIRFKP